jgi:hypothetical protein
MKKHLGRQWMTGIHSLLERVALGQLVLSDSFTKEITNQFKKIKEKCFT